MVYLTALLNVVNNWWEAVNNIFNNWGVIFTAGIDFNFTAKTNFIARLIMGLYEGLNSYGWTIILFTVILRTITLPLDFWQKLSMKKNSRIMQDMQPIMEKIDKAYGDDARSANAEKQKVMKKYKYSPAAMCLPTIVTMALFIFMFSGLNSCSSALNVKTYQKMQQTYLTAYSAVLTEHENHFSTVSDGEGGYVLYSYYATHKSEFSGADAIALNQGYSQIINDAKTAGKIAAIQSFTDNAEGFLWIKSLWRSDNWQKVLPKNLSQFTTALSGNKDIDGLTNEIIYDDIYQALSTPQDYLSGDELTQAKKSLGYGKDLWNGLLILPILAVALSFVTTLISNKTQGNVGTGQQAQTAKSQQKIMMFMMPVLMGVFAFTNPAAFALYLVSSSLISIIYNIIQTPIIDKILAKRESAIKKEVGYRR